MESTVSYSPSCPLCRKRALFVDQELYSGPPRRVAGSREVAEEEVDLDRGVWGNHLSEEVISTILAFLPLATLIRFRSVCKKWNAIISSTDFQRIRSSHSAPPPICLVDHHRGLMAYDLASGPWTVLSDIYQSSIYQHTGAFCGRQVVATAGGLILLTEDTHLHGLHIVNPSKTTWKTFHIRVPPLSPDYYIVGMLWNPVTIGYNILAAQRASELAALNAVELHLYDSRDKSWKLTGLVMPDKKVRNVHVQGVAIHKGRLHCLTVSEMPWEAPRFDVLRKDPGCPFWHTLPEKFPSIQLSPLRFRTSVLLFDYRGRLMAAGVDILLRTSVYLWQLDPVKGKWVQVRQLFEGPKENFSGRLQAEYHMQASGDYLCLCRYPPPSSPRKDPTAVFIYNLWDGSSRMLPKLSDSWRLIPERPRRRTLDGPGQRPRGGGQDVKHVLYAWKSKALFFQLKPDALV
ncbi:hypothetical protein R1flu_022959 [Riccia fluitans]|uniref:F-box domain-containing protein n=1 Tax=Riccia fluitans TaxID=41844 RepID=A0ABD1XQP1_9MARC